MVRVVTLVTVFLTVVLVLWSSLAVQAQEQDLTKAMCRQPALGCASLSAQLDECETWSGCKISGKKCTVLRSCDAVLCEMKQLAAQLSSRILPGCVRGNQSDCNEKMDHVTRSLDLASVCKVSQPFRIEATRSQPDYIVNNYPAAPLTWFVSPAGSDFNAGTERARPLGSIAEAMRKARAANSRSMKTIVIMPGKHRLIEAIQISPVDSNTTFQGESGAIVSASIPLPSSPAQWTHIGNDEYETVLPPIITSVVDDLATIFYKDEPMIRARHPNIAKYTETSWMVKTSVSKWTPQGRRSAYTDIIRRVLLPGARRYRSFIQGQNGACSGVFSPAAGYFCDPVYDADLSCEFSRVGQVSINPGAWTQIKGATWAQPDKVYFHALHKLKWGGWTYRVSQVTGKTLRLAEGGFQEARGDCGVGGADWFVENALELLDAPNEFFFDRASGKLRVKLPSGSTFDPSGFEINTKTTRLFDVRGLSSAQAVEHVHFRNLRLERTSSIHMKPHEMPSGGDWSVHRSGTLFFENARDVSVSDCLFTQLGSHGIFFSNHIKHALVERNVFFGLEASAMMLVGDPKYLADKPWDRTNDVDHVEGVRIRHNMVSDIGLMIVQSAAVFGALTKDIVVERNVFFDGPRAAVVYNDLYGNGMVTRENVMFNMVRLTLDHGPYNVWDRQQWMHPPGFTDQANVVERNFFIGTPGGDKVVDLDDAARDHVISDNVVSYGHIKLKGSNSSAQNNVIVAYLAKQWNCFELANFDFNSARYEATDNTCFAPGGARRAPYWWLADVRFDCSRTFIRTARNKYYGIRASFGACGSLPTWKNRYKQDAGSSWGPIQPASVIAAKCQDAMDRFGR